MDPRRLILLAGLCGFICVFVGAMLYAINSPHRTVTSVLLIAGGILTVIAAVSNIRRITQFMRTRSARQGTNAVIMILLFAGILVIVQALSARHNIRFDLTENKRFSLSLQTLNILRTLQRDVEVYAFFTRGASNKPPVQDLLSEYAYISPRFHYEFVDPDQRPQKAKDMDVSEYGTTVLRVGDKSERIGRVTEEALTNAIRALTSDVIKSVSFVTGHGEKELKSEGPSGYSLLEKALGEENYIVGTLSLFDEPRVPDDCDVLVVAGPTKDYFESEVDKIRNYLAKGNNALLMMDPQISLPNLEALIAEYRAILDDVVVIDPYSRVFGGEYTVPVVTQYVEHPITETIDVATFFPMARSVRISSEPIEGVTAQYLAQTGKSAWGETDLEGVGEGKAERGEDDVQAPVSIALIASRRYESPDDEGATPLESKIVVVGDSDFAGNSAFQVSGNADFLLNVIGYLAEEKDLITIRPKRGRGDRLFLTASQGRLIFLISVVLLPLGVIVFGTSVFVKKLRAG